eukprot:SAG22_NODE_15632_length_344_cov_0.942857_1_plen_95_part_10
MNKTIEHTEKCIAALQSQPGWSQWKKHCTGILPSLAITLSLCALKVQKCDDRATLRQQQWRLHLRLADAHLDMDTSQCDNLREKTACVEISTIEP